MQLELNQRDDLETNGKQALGPAFFIFTGFNRTKPVWNHNLSVLQLFNAENLVQFAIGVIKNRTCGLNVIVVYRNQSAVKRDN